MQKRSDILKSVSRRQVLKLSVVAGAGLALPAYIRPASAQTKNLVIVNSGGAMGDAKRAALYEPFTRKTGIEITTVSGPELAKIKVQVEQGDVEWDVVDLLEAWVPAAVRQDLLEPIDQKIVDLSQITEKARNPHAVGGTIFSGGIAFPTDRLKPIATWADFWDVSSFPGRRGLRTRINDTLEIALMADGVPPESVYPCDIERAFKALDRIKPNVSHWIAQTAQTVSLIQSNECDYTFTYTTRVKDLQAAGVPIGYSFKQNILGVGWLGVPRGTRKKDEAMQFLAFSLDPERQAELASKSGDAPTNPAALDKVDPSARKWLADVNAKDNLFTNAAWWDTHLEELSVRYKEWLLT
ncbi:extracellular solute-binding protein [Mesorhizobium sp. M7A.F.Ca.US.001.04.1.1]|uniref:extracellular solute-binding protein n=1 Tax=unclassified Mesorhizobium TaxID=325217 RepID=UPI000FCAF9CE|nr:MULTISPECIES: extracellular solute-binding protein [unclassified Mesorhizobium]RUY27353.1 extracellular solute-binding protein [Mesorhizobium sp. M7A.F.Ca.US.001.04.2.1]RUY36331.1 extracellular solute-binding protein [Mesorhizobium sp. M7A.F.Ca.US.001.04.1.1]